MMMAMLAYKYEAENRHEPQNDLASAAEQQRQLFDYDDNEEEKDGGGGKAEGEDDEDGSESESESEDSGEEEAPARRSSRAAAIRGNQALQCITVRPLRVYGQWVPRRLAGASRD